MVKIITLFTIIIVIINTLIITATKSITVRTSYKKILTTTSVSIVISIYYITCDNRENLQSHGESHCIGIRCFIMRFRVGLPWRLSWRTKLQVSFYLFNALWYQFAGLFTLMHGFRRAVSTTYYLLQSKTMSYCFSLNHLQLLWVIIYMMS